MVDIMSVGVGLFVGGCIGFLAAAIRWSIKMEKLQEEYDLLYREHARLTTRGPGGKFIKVK